MSELSSPAAHSYTRAPQHCCTNHACCFRLPLPTNHACCFRQPCHDMATALIEAKQVMTGAVGELLAKTGEGQRTQRETCHMTGRSSACHPHMPRSEFTCSNRPCTLPTVHVQLVTTAHHAHVYKAHHVPFLYTLSLYALSLISTPLRQLC
jgi:hypothetical protein